MERIVENEMLKKNHVFADIKTLKKLLRLWENMLLFIYEFKMFMQVSDNTMPLR